MSNPQTSQDTGVIHTSPQRRLRDVLDLAYALLAEHGLSDWQVRFDHARRRAGLCNYTTRTISLSRHYARHATQEHITDTVLHEIAHALVGPQHGHDAVWRQKAREIGCTATRCHTLSFSSAKWMMVCPNGCFAVERHRRKSGLVCASCKQRVNFIPAEEYGQL
ncbi:MAG: SprT-like domain-containing protein [Pseudomonadota bacterium]|nr:SprT-like domain-containing protein [Pseudomonadota bacterium]